MRTNIIAIILAGVALALSIYTILRPEVPQATPALVQEFDYIPRQITRTFDIPDSLYFLGERVPLEDPDVKERLDKEIHVNSFFHSNTIFLIKRANRWLPQISSVLKERGLPDDLKYIAVIESGLQNVISPSNAVGFWQFLRGTGREFDLEIDREVDERYSPIKSTYAACDYLLKAKDRFGSWTDAVASYNIGMRGLSNQLEEQKVESYYDLETNDETSRYVFRAIAIKLILSDPERYGFDIPAKHLYEIEPTREVEVSSTIADLAEWAKQNGINYKTLLRHNPWLRRNKLTVKGDNSYILKIPITASN